jgi:hypothetical protein
MSNYFVTADTVRLDLPDGEWIEVKAELSVSEEKRLTGAALQVNLRSVNDPAADIPFNYERFSLLKLYTWLVDWSLKDAQGKAVPLTLDTLGALRGRCAGWIEAALDAHIAAQAEEAKN